MTDWYRGIEDLFRFKREDFHRLEAVRKARQTNGESIDMQVMTHTGRTVNARATVCSDSIIRLRISIGPIVDAPSLMLAQSTWSCEGQSVAIDESRVSLRTPRFELSIERCPWRVVLLDNRRKGLCAEERADLAPFSDSRVVEPFGFSDCGETGAVHATFELAPDEAFYGLGEKFGPLDKRGQFIHCHQRGNGTWTEGDHKSIPFLMSSRGYGIFSHSFYPQGFAMGTLSQASYSIAVADECLDLFFIYGPTYKEMLSAYTWLTGRPQLPPKWGFGIWMSRCTYESRAQIEEIAQKMRAYEIPCDVLRIDSGWFHREGRGSVLDLDFTWNEENFPDPRGFIARLRDQGFKLGLFINTWAMTESAIAREARQLGYLIKMPDGTEHSWTMGERCKVVALDITIPACREWYKGKLKELLAQGVATFHIDWGIGSSTDARYAGAESLPYNNVHGLLYNQTVHEALAEHSGAPGVAPGIAGAPGIQRYGWTYAGDSRTTFRDMASVLRGGLSAAMSGISYWGCDIGGFGSFPVSRPDTRLYLRYVQHGFFLPFANLHGLGEREPWFYGDEALAVYRKFAELRYRLLPYIYTQAYLSQETGIPMLRPMVLEFPDDPNTRHLDMQYMFGPAFLVAPVFDDSDWRDVYLPRGAEWVDYWNGVRHAGGQWIRVDAPIDSMPLFVRAGSIVPVGPVAQFVDEKSVGLLTLEVYPAEHGCRGQLFQSGELHDLEWDDATKGLRFGLPQELYEIRVRTGAADSFRPAIMECRRR